MVRLIFLDSYPELSYFVLLFLDFLSMKWKSIITLILLFLKYSCWLNVKKHLSLPDCVSFNSSVEYMNIYCVFYITFAQNETFLTISITTTCIIVSLFFVTLCFGQVNLFGFVPRVILFCSSFSRFFIHEVKIYNYINPSFLKVQLLA